ncbi:MAG: LemA family protein [Burkholderiaceae bacterium]|jgi:LemA protein
MTSHWLFQLVVLAVLLAWVVGAYNRMVRLRAAIISAWEQIVAALVKRSEAMAAVVEAVREPLASEAATLQALTDADAKQRAAADGVRQARARIADVSLWVNAEAAVASPASRLRALIELQPALIQESAEGPKLAAGLAAWREAEPRILFVRQGFNDAVDRYNTAIHQWPTRLIASPLGFRSAGRI